jgi:hypothetical protein
MNIPSLSPIQTKLLRLALDDGATESEAVSALSKLRDNLYRYGPNPHELVDTLESILVLADRPNYGLCKIPFGNSKGTLFRDASPTELHSLREWCRKADPKKFANLVHDVDQFLKGA